MEATREYFECQCGLKDHMLVVEKDPELGTMIYVQAWVKGFWQRLRWLFRGGHAYWHDTLLRPEDLERFKKIIGV